LAKGSPLRGRFFQGPFFLPQIGAFFLLRWGPLLGALFLGISFFPLLWGFKTFGPFVYPFFAGVSPIRGSVERRAPFGGRVPGKTVFAKRRLFSKKGGGCPPQRGAGGKRIFWGVGAQNWCFSEGQPSVGERACSLRGGR